MNKKQTRLKRLLKKARLDFERISKTVDGCYENVHKAEKKLARAEFRYGKANRRLTEIEDQIVMSGGPFPKKKK